jgi:signal peptidase II
MKRLVTLAIVGVVLVFLDQVTKDMVVQSLELGQTHPVIPGFFSIASVRNSGAAFGFGGYESTLFNNAPFLKQIMFLVLPVIFCSWIAYLLYKTRHGPVFMSVAYMLIVAGATGNLIDRFRLGYVVDFLMFYWKREENHFHVFNIADSCVSIAAGLLIIDFFIHLRHKRSAATVNDSV